MKTMSFINECEIELQDIFNEIDNQSLKNSEKVINAVQSAFEKVDGEGKNNKATTNITIKILTNFCIR